MAVDINVVGPPGGMKGGGRRQAPRPPWHAAVSRTPLTTLCGLGFSFPRLQKAHLISPSSRTAPRPAAPAASAGKRRRGQVNCWGQVGTCFSRRTGHGAAIRLSFELNVSLVTEVTCSLQNPQALRKQTVAANRHFTAAFPLSSLPTTKARFCSHASPHFYIFCLKKSLNEIHFIMV